VSQCNDPLSRLPLTAGEITFSARLNINKKQNMSEEKQVEEKKVVETPKPLDWHKAEAHIAKIKEFQLGNEADGKPRFVGKPGFNPYLWIAQNVTPLEEKLEEGDRSPDLFWKIMGLKEVNPDGKSLKISSIKVGPPVKKPVTVQPAPVTK
jgi:hypothetical protein